jgi:hypothetical protein
MIQKQFTTREAAKAVGITRATVQAWIAAKKIRAPKPTVFAGIVVRMWSKADVKMLRAAKETIYRKGRGPKRPLYLPVHPSIKLPNQQRYVSTIPREKLAKGIVLVHNQVIPTRVIGSNGDRAWTQKLTRDLVRCHCKWAGRDLRGLRHYRVRSLD